MPSIHSRTELFYLLNYLGILPQKNENKLVYCNLSRPTLAVTMRVSYHSNRIGRITDKITDRITSRDALGLLGFRIWRASKVIRIRKNTEHHAREVAIAIAIRYTYTCPLHLDESETRSDNAAGSGAYSFFSRPFRFKVPRRIGLCITTDNAIVSSNFPTCPIQYCQVWYPL